MCVSYIISNIIYNILLYKKILMEIQVKIHVWNDLTDSKEVVERLVKENLENKLDTYLNKFDKSNAEWTIELKADKNKKGLFDAVLQANLDWNSFRYSREDYKKLDDLINHLFDHFKEELSK
jgi:hypothetical protein